MEKQFPDGYYKGWSFDNIHRDGLGQMIYNDNSVFYGIWKKNKRNGPGTLTTADGTIYQGEWINDILKGKVTITYKDKIVVAEYKNGKLIKTIHEQKINGSKKQQHPADQKTVTTPQKQTKSSTQQKTPPTATQSSSNQEPSQTIIQKNIKKYKEEQNRRHQERLAKEKNARIEKQRQQKWQDNENDANAFFEKGMNLFENCKFESAIQEFKSAKWITTSIELSKKCDFMIAKSRESQISFAEAERLESLDYHTKEGVKQLNMGNENGARNHLERAISLCTEKEYELKKKLEEYLDYCL